MRLTLVALAMTAAAAVAAVIAALAVAALSSLTNLLPFASDALLLAGTIGSYVLLCLTGAAGAAALYRFAPSRNAPWSWISPGSILAGLLWLGLTLGFGAYVARIAHFDATYGSLGAVIALLSWLYLSSYVLLFGAELNSELERQTAARASQAAASGKPIAEDQAPERIGPLKSGVPERTVPPAAAARLPAGQRFLRATASAAAARAAGLPRVRWIPSAAAMLGLSVLGRRGHARAGLTLIALAGRRELARKALSWHREEAFAGRGP